MSAPGGAVGAHGDDPGKHDDAGECGELQPATPVQPHTRDRVTEPQLLVPDEQDGAMHERGDERPETDAEHERDRGVTREHEHREHAGRKHGVENHEPPRLLIHVTKRVAQRRSDAHPLTPLATTPATKYRWKMTKSTTTGRIAITLAAINCGQSAPYWNLNCAIPS